MYNVVYIMYSTLRYGVLQYSGTPSSPVKTFKDLPKSLLICNWVYMHEKVDATIQVPVCLVMQPYLSVYKPLQAGFIWIYKIMMIQHVQCSSPQVLDQVSASASVHYMCILMIMMSEIKSPLLYTICTLPIHLFDGKNK